MSERKVEITDRFEAEAIYDEGERYSIIKYTRYRSAFAMGDEKPEWKESGSWYKTDQGGPIEPQDDGTYKHVINGQILHRVDD